MTLQVRSADGPPARSEDMVSVTIDGFEVAVPRGTLVIRAAEQLGIEIPRFCDHPLLDPIAACRQCLVQMEGQLKPPPACSTTCTDGMVVHTQLTSPVADKAQRGMMEFLLINHPLDCPMCDKGGECPLQNHAMSAWPGRDPLHREEADVRQAGADLHPDPAGPGAVHLVHPVRPVLRPDRGRPVHRLRRARARPVHRHRRGQAVQFLFLRQHRADLPGGGAHRHRVPVPGPAVRPGVHAERVRALRVRLPPAHRPPPRRGDPPARGDDPEVNEEWNCDKGRWAFTYATQPDRLVTPLVRGADGVLAPASWPEAIEAAARGLAAHRGRAGVLPGGRLTLEDAYAYAKFARTALRSNDIDMRARPHSAEEADFLAALVAGQEAGASYTGLERARAVLLACFEPEDESPMVFLRLRKAARTRGLAVYSIARLASRGLGRLSGVLLPTVPGTEARALDALAADRTGPAAASGPDGARPENLKGSLG